MRVEQNEFFFKLSHAKDGKSLSVLSIVVYALALSTLLITFTFIMYLAVFGSQASVDDQMFVYSLIAFANLGMIALFAFGVVFRNIIGPLLVGNDSLLTVVCLIGALGNVMMKFYASEKIVFFLDLALIAVVIYQVVALFAIGMRLSVLSRKDAGAVLGVSGCFFSLFYWLSVFNAGVSQFAVAISAIVFSCALPFMSAPSNWALIDKHTREFYMESSQQKSASPVFFYVCLLFCLISNVVPRVLTSPVLGSVGYAERTFISYVTLLVVFALMIVVIVSRLSRRSIIYCFVIVSAFFVSSFFVCIILSSMDYGEFARGVVKANSKVLACFLPMLAYDLARSKYYDAMTSFGLFGALGLALPELLLDGVVKRLNFLYGYDASPYFDTIMAIIALIVVVLSFATIAYDVRKNKVTVEDDPDSYIRLLCEASASDAGLTERELEIMQYLYRGFSVKKISEVLFLAPSTIQSHMRSLYRKMDVHSKQELIDFIDSATL